MARSSSANVAKIDLLYAVDSAISLIDYHL